MSVVHEHEVAWVEFGEGEAFANRRRQLSRAAGGKELGCSLTEIEPGMTGWPFHAHLGNEEAIYVLRGRATLRLGDKTHALAPGDYVAFVAREDQAHQITNTSDETFAYLALSTMNPTDIVLYPDSGKRGLFAGGAPGSAANTLTAFSPVTADVEYWDGEPVGKTKAQLAEEEAEAVEAAIREQVDTELEAMKARLSATEEPDDDAPGGDKAPKE